MPSKRRKEDVETVVPTRRGTDLQTKDGKIDGHIRIESYKNVGTMIYVDLFVSAVSDPDEAHITSEAFPWSDAGANDATKFLQENGFKVVIMIR